MFFDVLQHNLFYMLKKPGKNHASLGVDSTTFNFQQVSIIGSRDLRDGVQTMEVQYDGSASCLLEVSGSENLGIQHDVETTDFEQTTQISSSEEEIPAGENTNRSDLDIANSKNSYYYTIKEVGSSEGKTRIVMLLYINSTVQSPQITLTFCCEAYNLIWEVSHNQIV